MVMTLPKELERAVKTGHTYLSWIVPLNKKDGTAFEWFTKSEAAYSNKRFYWETPDGSFSLAGFGQEEVFKEQEASFSHIKAFQSSKDQSIFQNELIEGTGCLLLGGFSFSDDEKQRDVWGEMTNGYFFLPTFIVTEHKERTYLTINMANCEPSELEHMWTERYTQFEDMKAKESVLTKTTSHSIQTNEIGVSDWLSLVERTIIEVSHNKALDKVVVARQMAVESKAYFVANNILDQLKQQQENTYFFSLNTSDGDFIGATPERLLKGTEGLFSTASIAGSIPRGATKDEDEQLGASLLADQKNRVEHQIVVKRIMTELEALTQTTIALSPPQLLKNRDIQHLFLPIVANRLDGVSLLDGVKRLHPTPALGGEPKELALEWLHQHEAIGRGLYGAPIGWLSMADDSGEFVVGIRSGVFKDRQGYLFAGCGIVADSVPEMEREETKVKFRPMLRSIGGDVE